MSVFYSIGRRMSNLAERLQAAKDGTLASFQPQFKFYGFAQASMVMNLEDFTEHLESHNSKYDSGDYKAMLNQAGKCLKEMLLEGRKVCLGELGSFSLNLHCKPSDYYDEFTAANITDVKTRWEPSTMLKNLKNVCKFQKVETLKDQAELTKSIRESFPTRPEEDDQAGDQNNQQGTQTGGNTQTGGQTQGGGTVTPPAGGDNGLGE